MTLSVPFRVMYQKKVLQKRQLTTLSNLTVSSPFNL